MTIAKSLTYEGVTQSVAEWALDYGITPSIIDGRLERGMSIADAIASPMRIGFRGQRLPVEPRPPQRIANADTLRGGSRKAPPKSDAGVSLDFAPLKGTGGGSTAQEIPEITFSEEAENA